MNYNSISYILTLRYDPTRKATRKPLPYKSFMPKKTEGTESRIIEIVRKDLLDQRNESKLDKIGMSLSAGIDSSFTLAMIRSVLPDVKVKCFSMGFCDKDDEVGRAEELARIHDCDFHKIIKEDVLSDLPYLISIVKEPRWNLYQYYVLEAAKRDSALFYSGDGGDELFAGYVFRYHKFLSNLPKRAGWEQKAKLYLSCHERDWVPDQPKVFGPKIKFSWQKILRTFRPYFDSPIYDLDQVFLADFNGKLLYDWLPTNKAFEKFLKMRIRSVFLTNDMIRFATHLPWREKYDPAKNTGKLPLRAILKKQKGFEDFHPVKKGFAVDIASLWKKSGREIACEYLNHDSDIVKGKIISERWLNSAYRKLQQEDLGKNLSYINKMFGILSLEIWHKLFVSKTMASKQRL